MSILVRCQTQGIGMQHKDNHISSVSIKPVYSRYISFDEDIFNALNIFERSVYMALRFHADFRKQSSSVEITIDTLVTESKVKRRMLFHCLNALEKKFFLIKRVNWEKGTFGQTNQYEIAQHLNHFKPIEVEEKPIPEDVSKCIQCNNNISLNDNINGSYIEGVHHAHTVVRPVHTVVHPVHTGADEKQTYQDTYYPQPKDYKNTLSPKEMLESNPHNLPPQMIEDWVTNRKAKKSPVTPTAWARLNKQLRACSNPVDAFEECVASGWLGFKAEWINKPKISSKLEDNLNWDLNHG